VSKVRTRLPRYLIYAGTAIILIGIALTVTLVVRRSNCSANSLADNSPCLSYNPSIHWAFATIVLGAALFVAAALAGTNLVRRRTGDGESRGIPIGHDQPRHDPG
jgi:hypothetical protein